MHVVYPLNAFLRNLAATKMSNPGFSAGVSITTCVQM